MFNLYLSFNLTRDGDLDCGNKQTQIVNHIIKVTKKKPKCVKLCATQIKNNILVPINKKKL